MTLKQIRRICCWFQIYWKSCEKSYPEKVIISLYAKKIFVVSYFSTFSSDSVSVLILHHFFVKSDEHFLQTLKPSAHERLKNEYIFILLLW